MKMHYIAEVGAIVPTIHSLRLVDMKQLECDPSPVIIMLMVIDLFHGEPLNVLNYVSFN